MGRGKFKGKPTGRRQFSTPYTLRTGTSSRPRTFKQEQAEPVEEESKEESGKEIDNTKLKGSQSVIEVDNPNTVKAKNLKAKDDGLGKATELSRRERKEIEKKQAHEQYMRLREQGKTEQARKDLERLALIGQQHTEAAKKREEEKAA